MIKFIALKREGRVKNSILSWSKIFLWNTSQSAHPQWVRASVVQLYTTPVTPRYTQQTVENISCDLNVPVQRRRSCVGVQIYNTQYINHWIWHKFFVIDRFYVGMQYSVIHMIALINISPGLPLHPRSLSNTACYSRGSVGVLLVCGGVGGCGGRVQSAGCREIWRELWSLEHKSMFTWTAINKCNDPTNTKGGQTYLKLSFFMQLLKT